MSLKIRLARGGSKKRPFYKIVIADSRSPRDGRFIEKVGTYNPMLAKDNDQRVAFNEERVKYWLGVGAQPTDRVVSFLVNKGLTDKPAVPAQSKKHLPKAKAQERLREAAEKAQAEADAAAAAAAAPAEEAPAEEAPAEEAAAG